MKSLLLSVSFLGLFLTSECATGQALLERRPQIESALGQPSKEITLLCGGHSSKETAALCGLIHTCAYTNAKNGWKYSIDYIQGEHVVGICVGITYIKMDDSQITQAEVQQLLVQNGQNVDWIQQPASDSRIITYVRADNQFKAQFLFGSILAIRLPPLFEPLP